MAFSDKFERIYRRLLPSPFTIALLLTLFTFLLALIFTRPEETSYFAYSLDLMSKWETGLWNDSGGGLYFAFQMMLMLLLGHALALSSVFSKLIDALTRPCTTTARAAFTVTIATLLVSLFNWGLGLIFGAILARKVGEKFHRENRSLNYALIGAAAYSGLMVWHGGISGSAPIKAHEPGNLKTLVNGMNSVDISRVPETLDMSELIFSPMNLTVTILLLLILPGLMYFLGKRSFVNRTNLPVAPGKQTEPAQKPEGIERMERARLGSLITGVLILSYAFYKAFILPEQLSLAFLTPNYINLMLLGLALSSHRSIYDFLQATEEAIRGTTGILLQFPLYFGIMGLMVGSGLINQIADFFVEISSADSYPVYTFISAGIINVFVPSGGGQWAVQGPLVIAAAQSLGVNYGKAIMALAYGDQLTNMIQPFWALPLLGITGLKARDILPYTLLLMVAGFCIFMAGILLF